MSITLTEDQQYIHDSIVHNVNHHVGRYDCNIQGPAGTGKSTLISAIIKSIAYGFTVGVTAPTHRANRVLHDLIVKAGVDASDVDIMTIHSFLGLKLEWEKDVQVLKLDKESVNAQKKLDVLIVDECSMVSEDLMTHINTQSGRVRRAIIFLGDSCQLPPVEPDRPENKISVSFKYGTSYELTKVLRQAEDNHVIKLATAIRQHINTGQDPMTVIRNLECNDHIHKVNETTFYESYVHMISSSNVHDVKSNIEKNKILAYTNAKVREWNGVVRSTLYPNQTDEFFEGEPLIMDGVAGNCPYAIQQLVSCPKVKTTCWFGIDCWEMTTPSGEVFYCVGPRSYPVYQEKLQEIIEKIKTRAINKFTKQPYSWGDYYVIRERMSVASYPYASSIHKSQGSTFDNIWIDFHYISRVKDYDDKSRMMYTAITRPKNMIMILD